MRTDPDNGVLVVRIPPWSHACEKSVSSLILPKHRRFSTGTPVSSCTNTRPMRDGPYWTSRENSLVMTVNKV